MANHHQPTGTEPYCPDLAWLLCEAASALGERGTLAGTIAALERGGEGGNGFDAEQAMQMILQRGDCKKQRRLTPRWGRLSLQEQRVLASYYVGGASPGGVISGQVGPYKWVVMMFAPAKGEKLEKAARVLNENPMSFAATEAGRQAMSVLAAPLGKAREAVKLAHQAWRQTLRAQADKWVDG